MTTNKQDLFFSYPDLEQPYLDQGFYDQDGKQVELIEGLVPDLRRIETRWTGKNAPPDLPVALGAHLILSDRARNVWSLDTSDEVRLVPLRIQGTREFWDYWWADIRHSARIMDLEASEISKKVGPVVLQVDRFAVDESKIPDYELFICRENSKPVFCKKYVRRAVDAGLSGMSFVPIEGSRWPD